MIKRETNKGNQTENSYIMNRQSKKQKKNNKTMHKYHRKYKIVYLIPTGSVWI